MSTVQRRTRINGVVMTTIKNTGVKTSLAARKFNGIQIVPSNVLADTVGMPLDDSLIEAEASVFVEDFSVEHFSPGGTLSAVVMEAAAEDTQVPDIPSLPRS